MIQLLYNYSILILNLKSAHTKNYELIIDCVTQSVLLRIKYILVLYLYVCSVYINITILIPQIHITCIGHAGPFSIECTCKSHKIVLNKQISEMNFPNFYITEQIFISLKKFESLFIVNKLVYNDLYLYSYAFFTLVDLCHGSLLP